MKTTRHAAGMLERFRCWLFAFRAGFRCAGCRRPGRFHEDVFCAACQYEAECSAYGGDA